MKSITRKTLLYKSKVNYGDYAINHVRGCSHGCTYCYEMKDKVQKNIIKSYKSWTEPKIVENALELLEKELTKLKDKIEFVNLCFSTDPFMFRQKVVEKITLEIISMLNRNGIKAVTLTKGIYPKALADKIYSPKNEYGITLVSLDPEFQKKFEPGAAPLNERLASLRYLHERGLKTWVSIEPYPTPNIVNQDFLKLLENIRFVDKIIFGSWNYNQSVSSYPDKRKFYLACVKTLVKFCEKNGIEFHVKNKGQEFDRFRNAEIFKN